MKVNVKTMRFMSLNSWKEMGQPNFQTFKTVTDTSSYIIHQIFIEWLLRTHKYESQYFFYYVIASEINFFFPPYEITFLTLLF